MSWGFPTIRPARRIVQLLFGLSLFGIACGLVVRAGIGLDPWTVFAQGLFLVTGISIGTLTVLIGVVVLLLWIPLRQRPGLGTLCNIIVIGPGIDLGMWLIPDAEGLGQQALFFAVGLLLLAFGSALYIGAQMGTGPRDGLMIGLNTRLGWPIWVSRTSIEVTVLAIGWLLGGTVGVGTVLFALLIGPLCNLLIPRLTVSLATGERPAE